MSRSAFWTLIGTFFFLGLLLYGQSLGNSFVRWDDGLLIYENAAVRGFSLKNLKTIFTTYDPELYIPLTLLSYQIDYAISGTNASFYHFHSLVLHILNALLVVWFARRITGNSWIGTLTGLLFLVHPLNTEAVAWASGRKDVLSTLFFLLSLIGYDIYREQGGSRSYAGSLVALTLGLAAKVTVLTAPVLMLLIDLLRRRSVRLKLLFPHIALAILFAIIAYFGKTDVLEASTLGEKLLIIPASITFYLQKLIFPYPLSVLYPITDTISLASFPYILPIVVCALVLFLALWSRKYSPYPLFCLSAFLVTLAPSLLNFSKGDTLYLASDRYAYIPSIAFLLLFSFFTLRIPERFRIITVSVIVLVLSGLTFRQSLIWHSSETLFANVLAHYPETHTARNNMGNILRAKGDLPGATAEYEEALALSEEYGRGEAASKSQSKILTNLASALRADGDSSGAHTSLNQAEALHPNNPHVYLQRGLLHLQAGNAKGAEETYKAALNITPSFTSAKVNLGSLYVQTVRIEEAIAVLEEAIEQNPFYPQAFFNLGVALRKVERNREALEAYENAVTLEPAFVAARINLGILYAERKKIDEAVKQFQEVLQYDPDNARARSALSQLGAT